MGAVGICISRPHSKSTAGDPRTLGVLWSIGPTQIEMSKERGLCYVFWGFPWRALGQSGAGGVGNTGQVPGVVNPAIKAQWQEHVKADVDREVVISFAVAHPVHHFWFVQLRLQLVPKASRHCQAPTDREEMASQIPAPSIGGSHILLCGVCMAALTAQ